MRSWLTGCSSPSKPTKIPDYDAAWEAEIRERIAQIDRGEAKLIPWQEAIEQARRCVIDNEPRR